MDISLQRLSQQRLALDPLATPEEVVAWLGAVQAQDYPGAKWALGLRMQAATDEDIERAFDAGTILRTHALRPTWHFLTPADIRWILELTGPRVIMKNTTMIRRLELDQAQLSHGDAVIARALEGGRHQTRAELDRALKEAGIRTDGLRLVYFIMHAELEALVCSGPRRGKQFTYALLAERAPQARSMAHDEALAELTRRYFTSHGPATVQDFTWWSGLTSADASEGLAMAGSLLAHEETDGRTYWFPASMAPVSDYSQLALLLPVYDEFLVGYRGFFHTRLGGRELKGDSLFNGVVINGGRPIGSWRRTFQKGTVVIELVLFDPLSPGQSEAIDTAAQRFGQFLGLPVKSPI